MKIDRDLSLLVLRTLQARIKTDVERTFECATFIFEISFKHATNYGWKFLYLHRVKRECATRARARTQKRTGCS